MSTRPPRQPGFNLYWLYLLLFGLLVVSFFFMPERRSSTPITYLDFEQWVERRLVRKVVLIANRGEAEVYLTPQAYELNDIQQRLQKGFWGWLPFSFRVASVEKLEEFLQARRIPYEVTERTDYVGILLQYVVPIVLIIGVWVFLLGRIGARGVVAPALETFSALVVVGPPSSMPKTASPSPLRT